VDNNYGTSKTEKTSINKKEEETKGWNKAGQPEVGLKARRGDNASCPEIARTKPEDFA